MSNEPEKPPREPLSEVERQQIRYLLRTLAIIIIFVILASTIMGVVVTLLQ